MAFISIESVSKTYNASEAESSVKVLTDINAEIQDGEFVALMGPSGSGKSTLLTIIGAMNRPTSGRVLVDGIDVFGLSDERRADFRMEYLGFVFQQHHLMPYLTALENAMLPLVTSSVSTKEKRERGMDVLERVSLGNKASRLPNQLSGGEQGRLAIARALVNQPPLLLADEPTGTLDSRTGNEIMEVFLQINREGQTIFMVTHNRENAGLADRILEIRDGSLMGCLPTSSDDRSLSPADHALRGEGAAMVIRCGTRIPCQIPVTLTSADPTQPFSDPCLVILANPQGCAARFPRPVEVGAAVRLEGLPASGNVTARVVNCISVGEYEKLWLLGLALDEPGNIWGIQSPPQDWAQYGGRVSGSWQTPSHLLSAVTN